MSVRSKTSVRIAAPTRPLQLVPAEPGPGPSAERDRRQGGQSHDQALYSCGCGHRFEALVSTSVACPGCGDIQAW